MARKRPGNLWLVLRKPREAEVEGRDWGAFLFEVNYEGKDPKKNGGREVGKDACRSMCSLESPESG